METFDDNREDQHAGRLMSLSVSGAQSRMRAAGLTSILSLFLLLLAFFILLNSLAQFEARRTRAVLGSLAATFNVSDPTGQSRTLGSFDGHLEAVAEVEREITGLLRTLVGFGSFELIRTGNLLSTSIDNKVLFTDTAAASEKLKFLADPAAALLTASSVDVTIELTAYARPSGGRIIGARSDGYRICSDLRCHGGSYFRRIWRRARSIGRGAPRMVIRDRPGSNSAYWLRRLQRQKDHEPNLFGQPPDVSGSAQSKAPLRCAVVDNVRRPRCGDGCFLRLAVFDVRGRLR